LEFVSHIKIKLLLTTAFPAVTYGCNGKQIKDTVDTICIVRMNASVTKQIMPKHSVETLA